MSNMLDMCIKQGYVPLDCKLDGMMVWLLVGNNLNPCDGCNADCVHRKNSKNQYNEDRIEERKNHGTSSEPIIYVDAGFHDTLITAVLPDTEKAYIKRCKGSLEEAAFYIERMCIEYGVKQVIIPTDVCGKYIYDCLKNIRSDRLNIVLIKCVAAKI